jgi:hypothetical protein
MDRETRGGLGVVEPAGRMGVHGEDGPLIGHGSSEIPPRRAVGIDGDQRVRPATR